MTQYIGKVRISVNGSVIDSKPGASIDIGGVMRDSVVNDQQMGYMETPKPSRIECEVALARGTSIEGLRNLTEGTAVFECDTGQRYIVKDAFTSETLVVTGGQGVKLVMMGLPAEEVTA
jgi:hypothetical protein